jgi:hypothetical protein
VVVKLESAVSDDWDVVITVLELDVSATDVEEDEFDPVSELPEEDKAVLIVLSPFETLEDVVAMLVDDEVLLDVVG